MCLTISFEDTAKTEKFKAKNPNAEIDVYKICRTETGFDGKHQLQSLYLRTEIKSEYVAEGPLSIKDLEGLQKEINGGAIHVFTSLEECQDFLDTEFITYPGYPIIKGKAKCEDLISFGRFYFGFGAYESAAFKKVTFNQEEIDGAITKYQEYYEQHNMA